MYNYPKITLSSLEKLLQQRFSEDGFLSLKDLPNPSLLKDMDRATERIAKAIDQGEKIVLIGDYDVDGVVSTTLMKLFFDEIGVELEWIIPNRFRDGYGLSPTIIPRIEGFDLAITVDNGISAVDAAKMCRKMKIDLIITDHHLLPPEIPEAYAIIDQKQETCTFPYEDICGAQIAWYLIASLKNRLGAKVDIKSYLELVAIAIVADMMPLKHINRAMVLSGIHRLNQSNRPSIRAFKEHLDKEFFAGDDIGFQLAPIINSAGRMEDASLAVEFLLSRNIYDARSSLQKLVKLNTLRKEIEYLITQQALVQVDKRDEVLVVYGEEWHEGVIGIVAARVARHFEKPAIALTKSENGDYKGSGRSFGVCDLFEITGNCREYLIKFGGHQAAIGLTLPEENLELFKTKLQENYQMQAYEESSYDPDIVGELDFTEISFDLTYLMKQYEPYGQQNQKPKFISREVKILQSDTIGKENEHLRFAFEQNGMILTGVKFKSSELLSAGERVTLSYTINENYFRGKTSLQLLIDKININYNHK
ncbi:MAG: single-stranded-DNA-specific exonuclease RecJ [Campylobacterota bacterium]|nr:single-stranded-DNA-specific exonuclease RecJ [Campylobacterota bacterium]